MVALLSVKRVAGVRKRRREGGRGGDATQPEEEAHGCAVVCCADSTICALASAVVSVLLGKRYAQSPQICALVVCLDQQLCCNRCDGFRSRFVPGVDPGGARLDSRSRSTWLRVAGFSAPIKTSLAVFIRTNADSSATSAVLWTVELENPTALAEKISVAISACIGGRKLHKGTSQRCQNDLYIRRIQRDSEKRCSAAPRSSDKKKTILEARQHLTRAQAA